MVISIFLLQRIVLRTVTEKFDAFCVDFVIPLIHCRDNGAVHKK